MVVLVLVVDVVVVALVVMVEVRGAEAGLQRQHLLSAHAHFAIGAGPQENFRYQVLLLWGPGANTVH